MQDNALDGFITEIQQRQLVKKAESFCARWQKGFVAQDGDGEVYIYNANIRMN